MHILVPCPRLLQKGLQQFSNGYVNFAIDHELKFVPQYGTATMKTIAKSLMMYCNRFLMLLAQRT